MPDHEGRAISSERDAIKEEIASLLALDCFEFHSPDYKPSSEEYQWRKQSMIFDVKQDCPMQGLPVVTWLIRWASTRVRRS